MIVARSGHTTGGQAPAASAAHSTGAGHQTFSDVLDAVRADSSDQEGDTVADPGPQTTRDADADIPLGEAMTASSPPVDAPARLVPWVVVTLSSEAVPTEGEAVDGPAAQGDVRGAGAGVVVARPDLPTALDVSFVPVGRDDDAPEPVGDGDHAVEDVEGAGETPVPISARPVGVPGTASAGAPAVDAETSDVPVLPSNATDVKATSGSTREVERLVTDTPPEQDAGEATPAADARDGRVPGADVHQMEPTPEDRRAAGPIMDLRGQAPAPASGQLATGATAVAAPVAPPDLPATVLDQIVKSLRVQSRDGVSEARIQLRPEHLGALSIVLKIEGGAVTAVVRAESADVQDWVLRHQQSLREQLEAAGLRLSDLTVSPDAERRREPQHAPPRPRTRRADGSQPRFEVVV